MILCKEHTGRINRAFDILQISRDDIRIPNPSSNLCHYSQAKPSRHRLWGTSRELLLSPCAGDSFVPFEATYFLDIALVIKEKHTHFKRRRRSSSDTASRILFLGYVCVQDWSFTAAVSGQTSVVGRRTLCPSSINSPAI